MSVSVQKLANEPIIIVKYSTPFESEMDIYDAQFTIIQMMHEYSEFMYRIDDFSEVNLQWADVTELVDVITRKKAGSMVDPRIQGILVGEHSLLQLASDTLKHSGYTATDIDMYTHLQDAIASVRRTLQVAA